VSQSGGKMRWALEERKANGGDDQTQRKSHLETDGEELARVEYEAGQSGCSQGIEHAAVAVETGACRGRRDTSALRARRARPSQY